MTRPCAFCEIVPTNHYACRSCRIAFRHVFRIRGREKPDFSIACDKVGVSLRDGADLVMTYLRRTCPTPSDLARYFVAALIARESFEDGFVEIMGRYLAREAYNALTDEAAAFRARERLWTAQRNAIRAYLAEECVRAVARRRRSIPALRSMCGLGLPTADVAAAREFGLLGR